MGWITELFMMKNRSFFAVKVGCALALFVAIPGWTLLADSLETKLEARKAEFSGKASPEVAAGYEEGIKTVAESGIYANALQVGGKAPEFMLKDINGKEVRLSDLLKKGAVVLTWYRGGWCPYCNIALAAFQERLPEFDALGARIVALTPELPDYSAETVKQNGLGFDVLSDPGNKVAKQYGIVFKMTPYVAEAMQKNAKLHARNGDDSDELPLSATYIIAPDGTVTYAYLEADYRKRAEPDDLLKKLAEMQ